MIRGKRPEMMLDPSTLREVEKLLNETAGSSKLSLRSSMAPGYASASA